MSKAKFIMKRTGLAVIILALLLGSGGTYYFKGYLPDTVAPKSFPQIDGELRLDGLDAPVDLYRDAMGIAHIYASTSHDLFFAQGFVHAQDRFWQMDFYRHVGEGRTAEMFGSGQVETDIFLTTLGWRKTSLAEYQALSIESKAILSAYADGVNSYIAGKSNEELSLEYAVLDLPVINPGYVIEPWEPVNTLAWARALAWDLRNNLGGEIERAVLMKSLTSEQLDELFPPYPDDHPLIVNKLGDGDTASTPSNHMASAIPDQTLAAVQHNASLLDLVLGPQDDSAGSNSWVVSGDLTTTGKPLLANDPHLGINMPSIWYQISLHCAPKSDECPYDLAGFSLAGSPGVVLGHNDRIAWGFTFAEEDVMDLFIEKVNPENPNQYEAEGKWVDFETQTETIKVAGGNPVEVNIRATRHGPVLSDVYGPLKNDGDPEDQEFVAFRDRTGIELPENYVIALSWTALDTGNTYKQGNPFEAIWGFNRAQNWEDFREAARELNAPGQNLVYADVDGNIGYQTSGTIPIRKNGNGLAPVPGWSGEYDWIGSVPFEELPYTLNPVEGYIAPANNKIIGDDYPHFITAEYDHGFRANRIVNLIESAPGKMDIAYFQLMHADAYDASAEVFVPLLLQMNAQFTKPNEAIAFGFLQSWDFQATAGSQAAAVYGAFWRHLLKNTFNDELPEDYQADGGARWFEVTRRMNEDSRWWDDVSTAAISESRDEIIKRSFRDGVSELEKLLGTDPSKWTWGDIHVSNFRNGTLGESGIAPIESLFNRGPFPTDGGRSLINATSWDAVEGYEVTNVPSFRAIYDFSDFNNSVSIHTTGQSGHAFHPHYIDMAPLWANVEYLPMLWTRESIEADAEGHLVLTPTE